MNRYTRIAALMEEGLKAKTGWGRNEVMVLVQQVLNAVADEEVASLMSQIAAQTPADRYVQDRYPKPYPQGGIKPNPFGPPGLTAREDRLTDLDF